jgi:mono/diheme cytochrome c family protein
MIRQLGMLAAMVASMLASMVASMMGPGGRPLAGSTGRGAQVFSSEATTRVELHRTRQSASDLELGGELAGAAAGQTRFISYSELLKLPQESYTVRDDTNFGRTVRLSGVALERLPLLLGARPGAGMVIAICDDAYAAHYPAEYLRQHHPLLVLRVNGRGPAHWPVGVDGVPMGPYMVSHPSFHPAWRVLRHADEAQVPWGVVRLDFRREAAVYAPITPRSQDAVVQQGYRIAQQSCFRCHANAGEGGLKSNRSWGVVARRAASDPQYFDAYVRNPKKLNPASQMAASPQYDAATLRALRTYFAGFQEAP